MLGISTCWCSKRVRRGEEIVKEILELGLKAIELEYRISNKAFQQMRPFLGKTLTALSIHNYFPLPDDVHPSRASGDLFLLSSPDEHERSRAVAYSVKTIEHTHDLGAKAVVLHLGKVDMPNRAERFFGLYRDGVIGEKEGLEFIEEQSSIRRARKKSNIDAVLLSLDALNKEAVNRGIMLGVENRFHFHEIPDFEEIGLILEKFRGGNIGYWHDAGHAKVQENLGLTTQRGLLEAYTGQMIGMHFHDVRGLDDHLAPGQGEMDFKEIKAFLKPSAITILELHSGVPQEEVREGIRLLKRTLHIAD